jgi:hypothetical protein
VPKEVQETMGNYPKPGNEAKKKIPACELVKVEDAGHLHIESFSLFIEKLISFLND